MDTIDQQMLAALRRDGRLSIQALAQALSISRATARARLQRLQESGVIRGFTVVSAVDVQSAPVRGLMLLAIEGTGSERVLRQLLGLPEVVQVHSTNGRWDLIVELGTETLDALDKVLFLIRRWPGVTASETNLLLSTRSGHRV